MTNNPPVTLQLIGEGVTDVGPRSSAPTTPEQGVVTIVVHSLCCAPQHMRVKSNHFPFLQGRKLWQKVKFAKRQAYYNRDVRGAVFVMDSEGLPDVLSELTRGRDDELPDFPMAVGIAHPCVEAWLLCDGRAIQRALDLPKPPELPDAPESIPAPQQHRGYNPKTELFRLCGVEDAALKTAIAKAIKDLELLRTRCPLGFGQFADEVDSRLRPLFE